MSKEQTYAEAWQPMSDAKKKLLQAYNDLAVEMQQTGLVQRHRLDTLKGTLKAMEDALPKETRKKVAEAEAER